jgi:hypothetical protein
LTRPKSQCFDRLVAPDIHAPPARRFGALVVEDEKKIRTTLAKRLEEVGCTVRGVRSAEIACEAIEP